MKSKCAGLEEGMENNVYSLLRRNMSAQDVRRDEIFEIRVCMEVIENNISSEEKSEFIGCEVEASE